MFPDFDRADAIGEFWGYPESRAFAELLIDCEEDRTLWAVLVGMLRAADRKSSNRAIGHTASLRCTASGVGDLRSDTIARNERDPMRHGPKSNAALPGRRAREKRRDGGRGWPLLSTRFD
jgi:hypothetical protein